MNLREALTLAAAAALGFFALSWSLPLFDLDEGAFAQATLEMRASGDYLTTTLNGEPRYDKPILIYWLQAASVGLLGAHEFAFRLPSMLCATLWMFAVWHFTAGFLGRREALVAAGAVPLMLMSSIVGHGATADALLNLLIALTLLDIYRHSQSPRRGTLARVYLWMGLGLLAKGPIAVGLPLVVSGLFYVSQRRVHDWFKATVWLPGWVITTAVVLPWIGALYLRGDIEFLQRFLVDHNLSRFSDTREGHGGALYYYLLALPLIVLPFSGLLPAALSRARSWRSEPLDAFLLIWFAAVFVLFSFSATQLPHYLLYGATPLFILFGRCHADVSRATLLWPATLLCLLLAALPLWLPWLPVPPQRVFERGILELAQQSFGFGFALASGLSLLALAALWRYRRQWSAAALLLGAGFAQGALLVLGVAPVLAAAQQQPVKEAALRARELGLPTVSISGWLPSFSVYYGAPLPQRPPQPGELVFLRTHNLQALVGESKTEFLTEYQKGGVILLRRMP